jgi:hypothetical protein
LNDYQAFLERKMQFGENSGFTPKWIPDFLFDFQASLLDWGIRKGRFAAFEDCGLGKTPQELVWAENIVRKTNGRVLILTPLAVAHQHVTEAEKFGIEVYRSRDGKFPQTAKIIVTNYEQLHHFNPNDFVAIGCDESSILKNFDGATKSAVTEFARKLPYRSLWTATAAPNDYIELGTSSEALGELGYTDMLQRFFKNDQNTVKPMSYRHKGQNVAALNDGAKWRFKGHAETPFWRWVASWARALRRPSDLDSRFDDSTFILPKVTERQHMIKVNASAPDMLFPLPAVGLKEQRDERRRTIEQRCELAAELCNKHPGASVAWCHLNPEGDLLAKLIKNCVQVSGSDSDDEKEEKLLAFVNGQVENLVTKQTICGWGLNWQHCHHTVTFPSHSYERYYQAVRRFWRFGQTHPVTVDIVTSEGELNVLKNLQRKTKAADRMFSALVAEMNQAVNIDKNTTYKMKEKLPNWL